MIYLLFYRTHVLCILGSECVGLSIVVYFHNRKKPQIYNDQLYSFTKSNYTHIPPFHN